MCFMPAFLTPVLKTFLFLIRYENDYLVVKKSQTLISGLQNNTRDERVKKYLCNYYFKIRLLVILINRFYTYFLNTFFVRFVLYFHSLLNMNKSLTMTAVFFDELNLFSEFCCAE